jgi:hypothetical protein
MPPFKIRLLGISYDSAADIDSTRLSFEPGNILSPHISVKDIFELETGLKIDQARCASRCVVLRAALRRPKILLTPAAACFPCRASAGA